MIFLVLALENLLFPFVALAFIFKFAFSRRRALLRHLPEELSQRFGRISPEALKTLSDRRIIWIHAASAGEVLAASELIRSIKNSPRADNGQKPPAIIVTTSTAAGQERARSLAGVDAAFLAPLDFYPAVSAFLARVKPEALLIIETEIWPHLIALSFHQGVKIAVVNGRISDKNFSRMAPWAFLIRPFMLRIRRIVAQSDADAGRFMALGAPKDRVRSAGNLKYDVKPASGPKDAAEKALSELGWIGCPIFVAGSTHPGEEDAVLDAFQGARKNFPFLRLVLAPRHVERAREVSQNLVRRIISYQTWSALAPRPTDALLLDAMGILPAFYGKALLSFVGGTLVPIGGHNILEPALCGCPVAFGPHTHHVAKVARILLDADGGIMIRDAKDLARSLEDLLAHPEKARAMAQAARAAVAGLQGAVERTLDCLQGVI